jgi:hypothetical protein
MLLSCVYMQVATGASTTVPTNTNINNSSSSSSSDNSSNSSSTLELKPQHGYRAEGKSSIVFQRYCHLYKQSELEQLCEEIAGCEVLQSYYDNSNWCVVLQKTADS